MDSHIRELRNRGISAASLSSEDVDEHNLLKEAYAFLFGSPEAFFIQNEKWRNMSRSNVYKAEPLRSLMADKNIEITGKQGIEGKFPPHWPYKVII